MSGFSADWLALREPHDRRARSGALEQRLRTWKPSGRAWRVVDLACGTGANLRHLAPRLGGTQHWLLVDHDAELVAQLPRLLARWSARSGLSCERNTNKDVLRLAGPRLDCRARVAQLDLYQALQRAIPSDTQVVVCNALLDLVSAAWLEGLADRCQALGAALLCTLSYDGRIRLRPPSPHDAWLRRLVNHHQRGDKGFGPALGPTAAEVARRILEHRGYRVWLAASDWQVGGDYPALQRELLAGWAQAACEQQPTAKRKLRAWSRLRAAALASGKSRLRVGHQDLLALSPG